MPCHSIIMAWVKRFYALDSMKDMKLAGAPCSASISENTMPHFQLGQLQVGCARAQVQLWPSHLTPWHSNLRQTKLCGPDHQEGNWDWATTKQHEEGRWSDLKQDMEPSHSVPETGDKASPGWWRCLLPFQCPLQFSLFSSWYNNS